MEKEKMQKKEAEIVEWYDNPNFITTLSIIALLLIIILSQSFAVKNNIGSNAILRNLLNHNSIYLVGLLYFIPLKTKVGKKYFDFLNLFLILIYTIFTVTSVLTIIQSLSLISLVTLGIYVMFLIYMIHSLLCNTRIWKEFRLDKSPFNDIGNLNYFYTIVILGLVLLTINLIQTSTFDGAVISMLVTVYIVLLSRYIYLYKDYVSRKKNQSKKGNK
ncbi:MAG: hypothetical protein HFJ12_02915 [Bacilli bacterium]|nr:hypothetical protein [Bacilli bacterium]